MAEQFAEAMVRKGFADTVMEMPGVNSVVADRDDKGRSRYIVHLESKAHYYQNAALFEQAELIIPPPPDNGETFRVGGAIHYVFPPDQAGA